MQGEPYKSHGLFKVLKKIRSLDKSKNLCNDENARRNNWNY